MKTLTMVLALAVAAPAYAQKVVVIGGKGGSDTPPTAVTFQAQDPAQPHLLSWNAPDDDDGTTVGPAETYTFLYSTAAAITQANYTLATSVDLGANGISLFPAAPGTSQTLDLRLALPHVTTSYWVSLMSTDSAGHKSLVATASPLVAADFDAPLPVALQPMEAMEASAVTLTWSQPPSSDAMEISFEYAATDTFAGATETAWMSNTAAHTAVLELGSAWWGRTVYFRAQARDPWQNESAQSNTASAMIISPFADYVAKSDSKNSPCGASAAGATALMAFAALAFLRR